MDQMTKVIIFKVLLSAAFLMYGSAKVKGSLRTETDYMYQCFDGSLVPMEYFCDGVGDCSDQSDEVDCFNECVHRHDIYGELYQGRRDITRNGDHCVSSCRGQIGKGVICTTQNNTSKYCDVPYCNRHGGLDQHCDFSSSFCGWKARSNTSINQEVAEANYSDDQYGVIKLNGSNTSYFVLSIPLLRQEMRIGVFKVNITVKADIKTYWTYVVGENYFRNFTSMANGWTNQECKACAISIVLKVNQSYLYFFAATNADFNLTVIVRQLTVDPWYFEETNEQYYCNRNEYPCQRSGRCIPVQYTLDYYQDCPMGDDLPDSQYSYFGCRKDQLKCEYSYSCIPLNSSERMRLQCLQDKHWPFEYSNTSCPGYLQCRGNMKNPKCIAESRICDGIPHCSHWDDEINCHVTCPSDCNECSDGVYKCLPTAWRNIPREASIVNFSGYNVDVNDICLFARPLLQVLKLSNCGLKTLGCLTVYLYFFLPRLTVLDISYNFITTLAFLWNINFALDLSGNPVVSVVFNIAQSNVTLRNSSLQELQIASFNFSLMSCQGNIYFNTSFFLPVRKCKAFEEIMIIRYLDLSKNKINSLRIESYTSITLLNLSYNELSSIRNYQFSLVVGLTELYLNNNLLTNFPQLELDVFRLLILNLSSNRLNTLENGSLQLMYNLQILLLNHNNLIALDHAILFGLFKLKHLELAHNLLNSLPRDIFKDQIGLEALHLQDNKLTSIERNLFKNAISLVYLDLRGNNIDVYPEMFRGLGALHTLLAHDSAVCCARLATVSRKNCNVEIQTLSSCEYLLKDQFLSVVIWFLSFTIIIGNIDTARHSLKSTKRQSKLYFQLNISVVGFLSGVYLLFISFKDLQSKGEYGFHHNKWRESTMCDIARICLLISVQGSTIFSFIASICRHFEMKLHGKYCKRHRQKLLNFFVWVLLISESVMIVVYDDKHQLDTHRQLGICSSFFLVHDSTYTDANHRNIYNLLTVGQGMFMSVSIIISEIILAFRKKTLCSTFFSADPESNFYVTIVLIISRNTVITAFGLLPLWGARISIDTYTWFTVLGIPLDSAVNPPLLMLRTRRGDH